MQTSSRVADQKNLTQYMDEAIGENPAARAEAQKAAQSLLKLDDVNFAYYLTLFDKYKNAGEKQLVKLHPATDGRLIGYPVGLQQTPPEISARFKSIEYATLLKEHDGKAAKRTALLLKKLQAGTGSSMTRESYFQRNPKMREILNLSVGEGEMKMGAKGTDLLVDVTDPSDSAKKVSVSIVELQILQAIAIARSGVYAELILQDIVGPETKTRMNQIWQKKSLPDSKLSYQELIETIPQIARFHSSYQSHVPALTESGEITFNRLAPAGHGLFAVDAIRAALHPDTLPKVKPGLALVSAIANGEDLSSLPDAVMVDWMVKNRIPIVLVTTSKTRIDMKTGILCLVKDQASGELYLKVLDTAEAKAAGQLEQFEKMDAIASTNMTLFNYEVLVEKLKGLSEHELLRAMAPDLVPNWKEQKDSDGITRKYLQLEGTMGSVIMNLDRYFRKEKGEALVSIINVDPERRTDFFSPIKSAFDYFLQFHSDRFALDEGSYKLKHTAGVSLPMFQLKDPTTNDKYYQDVQNVLESFSAVSVREMDQLEVSGQVKLSGFVLRGKVVIKSEAAGLTDLNRWADQFSKAPSGRPLLENIQLTISRDGELTVT